MSITERKLEALETYPRHLPGPIPLGKISYEEFFEWADEDTHAEWVDGEIDMPSPVSLRHQRLVDFLSSTLGLYAQAFNLGEVFSNGLQMKLPGENGSGRQPDVLFVTTGHSFRLEPTLVQGPADLAIEVLSPQKRDQDRDRITKFAEYATGGVTEYWLIDPNVPEALFYHLDEQGQYQPITIDEAGKIYSGVIAGFWLRVEWLWRTPLPEVQDVLKVIGGSAYAAYLNQAPPADL